MPTTESLLRSASILLLTSGEIEDFDAALAEWIGDSTDKAQRIAAVRRAAVDLAAQAKALAEEHAAVRKRHEATADRCGYLMTALLTTRRELGEGDKIPGVARMQKNGGKAPLVGLAEVDPNTLPDALCKIVRSPVADLVRAALLAGESIPGVSIGEVGESVRFE
ncbi:MAG: hypothetical protein A3F76_08225 [Burkholderiales bacterium RIFCSPLOWO2_12_FULL_65_40]|nr:MAG: hypothetical protein A3F76_08225 [Burkholderiales bacterium RIFCSPLOWO2_12_FULL_65_40]